MNRWLKTAVLSVSLLVLAFVTLGYVLAQTSSESRPYRSLNVFVEVLQRIQSDWVEEPDMNRVSSGALHGLIEALDPYSAYLSPLEYSEFKSKQAENARGRVGLALSKRFGYVIILSVQAGSPAHRAGLRSGDIIESIGGFTTREMSIGQAELLLAGAPDTAVKVAVVRRVRGEQVEMELIRKELEAPKLIAEELEGGIAYLGVPSLESGKAAEIRRQLAAFERRGLRRLILDLRDCAAGDMSEGIETARLFLASGSIATLRGQTVSRQDFAADPAKVAWKHPVTVLLSGGTSGAAELVAAGIRSAQRGDLVGERTFGGASQQKLITLEDGAAIILTVANYYTPEGASIPAEGISPTVEVSASRDDLSDSDLDPKPNSFRDDPALKKALEMLLPKQAEGQPAPPRRRAAARAV